MLFGVPVSKDATGAAEATPAGSSTVAISDVAAEVGDAVVVMSDLCLDEFTDHGHCGVLAPDGSVDNDATLERYAEMAVAQAAAGVAVVGPSGMMDGQVGVIRAALDAAGHTDVAILAYSAKYASAFFSPFREAVSSTLQGTGVTYQQDPANSREAVREVGLDLVEGADMVMVKPALGYLDIVRGSRGDLRRTGGGLQRVGRVRHGRGGSRRRDISTARRRSGGPHLDPPGRGRHRVDLLGRRGRRVARLSRLDNR